MPIVFDEVTADIAPPADAAPAPSGDAAAPSFDSADPVEQVRRALALLREREARLIAD